MIIRCFGARGSIAVSGSEYLKYGGDTTCLEIRTRNNKVIVLDAGSGIRRLGLKLFAEKLFDINMIFTHTHWDHILGFPFFKPLYHPDATINLLGCPTAQGDLKKLISRTMSQPYFPIPFESLLAAINYSDNCAGSFQIDTVSISQINLSHPNLGAGYKFVEDGKTFVFITDNELGYKHRGGRDFDDYAAFAAGADLFFHDAEYTPEEYRTTRTWGHSTYTDATNLALKAGVKKFGLFHHNQNRNDRDQDAIVENCREIIRKNGSGLDCFAARQLSEIVL